MIHLDNIRRFSVTMPNRIVAVSGRDSMNWLQFEKQTEARIRLLLAHLPEQLPAQACFVAPNSLKLLPWLAALVTLGITVTGIDYTLPDETLHELSMRLDARLLLVASSSRGGREASLDFGPLSAVRLDIDSVTLIDCYSNKWTTSEESIFVRGTMSDPYGTPRVPIEELLETVDNSRKFRAISLTSGTSGASKAVLRTCSFDQRRFKYFTERYGFSQSDRFLVSMPLYHAAGNSWARMFIALGATLVLAPIDSPKDLVEALCNQNVTASVMTPATLGEVIDLLEGELDSPLALRWLLIGGKHFPVPHKKRALNCLGDVVYEYYGTTETGVNTIAEPLDLMSFPESVGRPFEGNSIAVVESKGKRLKTNEVGIVAVASYMNMDRYSDGTTREFRLDGERYLLTPDQGYLDFEGRLFLINRGGDAGNTSELYGLEDAIRELPCIVDVALVQREDRQIDCAIVVRDTARASETLHPRVRSLASAQHLSVARCLNVPRIPYSPTGKIKQLDVTSYFNNSES